MNRKSQKTAARRARIQVSAAALAAARAQLQAEADARHAAERKERYGWVEEIGAPAFASLADMVAAYELDWDRLEELRDERDGWTRETDAEGDETGPETWAEANPDEAAELAELEEAAGDCTDKDDARERIEEDALSVQVRSGWVDPGTTDLDPEDFEILLTTGGPAVRILGELDEHHEPRRAWLEVHDWGKPWTEYHQADPDTLLTYARCFSFGNG